MDILIWRPVPWVRTTLDEDEVERQRIRAILAKLPAPEDEPDEPDDQEEN